MKNTFKFFTLFLVILFAFGCESNSKDPGKEDPKVVILSGIITEDIGEDLCSSGGICIGLPNNEEEASSYYLKFTLKNTSTQTIELTNSSSNILSDNLPVEWSPCSNQESTLEIPGGSSTCVVKEYCLDNNALINQGSAIDIQLYFQYGEGIETDTTINIKFCPLNK